MNVARTDLTQEVSEIDAQSATNNHDFPLNNHDFPLKNHDLYIKTHPITIHPRSPNTFINGL